VSWDLRIGQVADDLTLYDGNEVMAAVAGIFLADGATAITARAHAKEVWNQVNGGQRGVCHWNLASGRVLAIWDSSPMPQYDKQCDGVGSDLNRCGRYLNHPGSC
jgi:hypothetical protein